MESGEISNGQVSASSEWDGNHAAIQARLYFEAAPDKAGSWSAKYNNTHLEIAFFLTRLLLQCNFNQELLVRQKKCIVVETRNACFSKLLKIQHDD